MLTHDNILEIALNANFKTTINMIKAFKFLDGLWKMKIKKLNKPVKDGFTSPYFEFWSGCQNYLIHCKKMCLNVNFGNYSFFDNYLYEYSSMLQNILNTVDNNISYESGYHNNTIIPIEHLNQFIVLYENDIDYKITILGSYNTNCEALNAINDKRELLSANEDEGGSYFRAVIINLEYMIPYFIKYTPVKSADTTRCYTFYNCYKNDLFKKND